jgi:glutathione synthase/RimK-type ligase-like ATP-grasp enzyme
MSKFKPRIRSRHPSHSPLREQLPRMTKRAIVRLGSTTPIPQDGKNYIEVNTTNAINNSANKLLMKQCFTKAGVKTAQWFYPIISDKAFPEYTNAIYEVVDKGIRFIDDTYPGSEHFSPTIMEFPVVAKHIRGSRGTGNYLIKSKQQLEGWMMGKNLENYIFEKFYNYNREYRLHVTKDGCFYTCRKLLKEDTPEDKRWFRNDSNSVWVVEDNPSFDKPSNWDAIVAESVKALNAVGLDVGAVDVRVQSATKTTKKKGEVKRENPEFIIIEINSAPSFGEITLQKYLEEIPKIINSKI